jgi:hypothetical protein
LQGPYERNNIRQGIYDEPAPPQPIHLNRLARNSKSYKLFDWKYYILILFITFISIIMFITSISPDVKNPIEKI